MHTHHLLLRMVLVLFVTGKVFLYFRAIGRTVEGSEVS